MQVSLVVDVKDMTLRRNPATAVSSHQPSATRGPRSSSYSFPTTYPQSLILRLHDVTKRAHCAAKRNAAPKATIQTRPDPCERRTWRHYFPPTYIRN